MSSSPRKKTSRAAKNVATVTPVTPVDLSQVDSSIEHMNTNDRKKKKTMSKRSLARLEQLPMESPRVVSISKLSCRAKALVYINHKYATLLLTLLTLMSILLVFIEMFKIKPTPEILSLENWIMGMFGTETVIRLILMGPKAYFTEWMCVCDFCVSLTDLIVFCVTEFGEVNESDALKFVRVLRVSRLSKVTRISRLIKQVDKDVGNEDRGEDMKRDEDGHIFSYNSASLFSLGWMYNLAGTVASMAEIWVQSLMLVIVTTLLAALTCPLACDPNSNAYDGDLVKTATCIGCVSSIPADFGLMFLGLAAFLLGIFAQMLFDRWWQLRQTMEELFAEILDTAMLTLCFIRGTDEKSRRVREDIIRWAKLGAYLLEKQIDGKKNFRAAVISGLLTEREWDKLEKHDDNYMLPQSWAMNALCKAQIDGLVSEHGGTFDNLIMTFTSQRRLCTDILMFLNTPIPYIFTHLMTVICKVNLVFTGIACGTMIGTAIEAQQWLAVFIGYSIVVLGNMLVEGLLRLHVVLSDPFGDDACDFPWENYMEDVKQKIDTLGNQFDDVQHSKPEEIAMSFLPPKEPEVQNFIPSNTD